MDNSRRRWLLPVSFQFSNMDGNSTKSWHRRLLPTLCRAFSHRAANDWVLFCFMVGAALRKLEVLVLLIFGLLSAPDLLAQPTMPQMGESAEAQPTAPSELRRVTRGSQQLGYRLASVPKMFGDTLMSGGQLLFLNPDRGSGTGGQFVPKDSPLPSASAYRRSKITENNNPLPENRVFFMYNHFHNAFALNLTDGFDVTTQRSHLDQYTVGIERLIFDDTASLEVRMPFMSSFDFVSPIDNISGGNVGNLALIYKQLLYWEDTFAIGAGTAVELPTGSDVDVTVDGSRIKVENDAARFLPFVGLVSSPSEDLFWQFTAQVDLGSGGNRVLIEQDRVGKFNDQNLLHLDFSIGRWLIQDSEAELLTGLAGIVELHYTTSMQDADQVSVPGVFSLTNISNRFDVLNLTAGLNAELSNWTNLRVAGVAPLRREDRFFDSEFQVQLNRWY